MFEGEIAIRRVRARVQRCGGAMATITLESDSSHSPPFRITATSVPLKCA